MTTQVRLPDGCAWTFTLLPGLLTRLNITPWGVLHVGAHHGQEVPAYRACGFARIHLVEPDPHSLAILYERFGADADVSITAAAAVPGRAGQGVLHYAQSSVWSGLRPHPTATGVTVPVATAQLAGLQGAANLLVLDTQGTELELLAAARLDTLNVVIAETTRREGDSAAFYDDAVQYMTSRGWTVVEEWVHDDSGYTDTVWTRPR